MIEKEKNINKLYELIEHWNTCDLNGIAKLLSNDVSLSTPPVKMGPFILEGSELSGRHHVLKFYKELFEKYSFQCENVRIINVTNNALNITIDYPNLKFSAHSTLHFNIDHQITSMYFNKVSELGMADEAKTLPLMLRLFKNRVKTKFGKV